ncbi:MAG TPA: primosomal protein N' [Gammaproteobacteria bacterium]|nr:primosomal protein N' [Gammaproteobacteria bacterium]
MNQTTTGIIQVAVPTPLRRFFDYLLPESFSMELLQPGIRLRIPFQHRELIGVFIGFANKSDVPPHKLKHIIECLDHQPVMTPDMLELCHWAASYYHYPIGEVILGTLPAWLRQGKAADVAFSKKMFDISERREDILELNSEQQNALNAIEALQNQFQVLLLDGVTGSGKTEVYLQAIAKVLARGSQVMVLVPEIGLTPQTIQRFRMRFSVPVVALHSGMTEKQRYQAWYASKKGIAKIIIGTRSAVFTPFVKLGLIVIDEEHDLSFKQQDSFRYHARDVAIMRAHLNHIPVVLGSATPSLETLHNVRQGRYQYLQLKERAGGAKLPQFHVLNIRNMRLEQGLSLPLMTEMREHLEKGNQVMLFLNRRGFAPIIICETCGWMVQCKRCDARMTYHYATARLHCHHCDTQRKLQTKCEGCGESHLQAMGQGTERIEKVLSAYFPNYSIARIDRDTTRRKGSMDDLLTRIQSGEHQILIGTQMLAKGHHFPNVTLVAILDADGGFFSADFRALERMGQLLLQVSGRAGRTEKAGKVLIQTRHANHPLLFQLLKENYQKFSSTILEERKQAELPPYTFFALFRAEAHREEYAMDFLQQVKSKIVEKTVTVVGPLAALMPRRAGKYRVQLLLQCKQRSPLQQLLKNILPQIEAIPLKSRVRWSLDVDPLEVF